MSDFNPSIFDDKEKLGRRRDYGPLGWEAEDYLRQLEKAIEEGSIPEQQQLGASRLIAHVRAFKDEYMKRHKSMITFQVEYAELLQSIVELRGDIAKAAAIYLALASVNPKKEEGNHE